jgi:hypothetical protein
MLVRGVPWTVGDGVTPKIERMVGATWILLTFLRGALLFLMFGPAA